MNIYAHSCLKLLSNRPEAVKIHVQIMKFKCRLNMPFADYPHCRSHFGYGCDYLTSLSQAKHL